MQDRHVIILGIRGIPAAHGGFETFAERLAPWLRDRGWRVTVYCQGSDTGKMYEDDWEGIHRIHIPVRLGGAAGTIEFDVKSARDAMRRSGTLLTLGYNTGFLSMALRARGRTNVINMDGLEWKRAKYSKGARGYLWVNERFAAAAGDILIADHPEIAVHLATRADKRRIVVIPYGSERIETGDATLLGTLGLEPGRFMTLIARPEPENSVLEIVQAVSAKPRGVKLALLGKYAPTHAYQAKVLEAAGPDVVFTGAIYDKPMLAALRHHSLAYLHGHQVGGTNPSLVEALGAGNAVIAHDNPFNRWVAGDAGLYFTDVAQCGAQIDRLVDDPGLRDSLRAAAVRRWEAEFTWPAILSQYEELLGSVS
jgi:glycosyltransferase involved in cell wall biosynthesis